MRKLFALMLTTALLAVGVASTATAAPLPSPFKGKALKGKVIKMNPRVTDYRGMHPRVTDYRTTQ